MKQTRRELLRWAAAAAASPLAAFDGGPRPAKKDMIVRSARPEDLEMPPGGFADYITPVEHFFVRSHHYEPQVDLKEWRLTVDGKVSKPLALTLDEVKKMPRVEYVAVLECAGNGRAFYRPTVPGLQWRSGSVGNGRWAGVRLADVLKRAGLDAGATEILFDGADVPVGTMPEFQRTIPVRKAMHPDTILAYEMNGQTLPVQHGFPLRVIAPGWASDSWVKWLTRITALDHEFDGFFMKTAYRHPGKPVKPGEAVDAAKMQPVTSLRVKSVIGAPAEGVNVPTGRALLVTGAAWAGDGGPVASVEVSTDAGRTWNPARLGAERSQYGWRLFQYTFTPAKAQYYTVMSRARTAAGDIQPLAQEWNPSGYAWNVVPAVGVNAFDGAAPSPAASGGASGAAGTQPSGYKQSCLVCHGEDVIEQQRLTGAQWDREVEKMVRWGARVKPEEREGILKYLRENFLPRP